MIKKILIYSLCCLLILALLAGGGGYWFVKHKVAVTSGVLTTGVQKPVRIVRDDYGIPHIYAENQHDVMYAQGYAQAQDRMWQMELYRRMMSGRLSEVMGESTIAQDRMMRTYGFYRLAADSVGQLDAETKQSLQAFTDGINAYLQEDRLPIEFTLLGYQPEPWQIKDTILISKFTAWELGGNLRSELFLTSVGEKVGMEKALSIVADYPAEAAKEAVERSKLTMDTNGSDSSGYTAVIDQLFQIMANGKELGGLGESIGSNAWVISGSKSASGKPMLANDMHLALDAPSLWYQNHLEVAGEYQVTGVTFPGVPGVVAGHNDKIAWGFTNVQADTQDLYVEKPNPSNPRQFEYMGRYEDAQVVPEEVKVKGHDEPEKFDVLITRHGPIITDVVVGQHIDKPLALKWTANQFTEEIRATLQMDRAKNWAEFEAGIQRFTAPAQNVMYADVDGNIAYHANGKIPIRKKGDGLLPVPGWTDEYEWTSYIEWDKLPHAMNPAEGYLITANNKVVDNSYPYLISNEYAPPFRATRIQEMLKEKSTFTQQDFQRMQSDWKNLEALQNTAVWLPILEKSNLNDRERQMLTELKEWLKNPVDDPNLIGPTIYHTILNQMTDRMFKPQLGDDLYVQFINSGMPANSIDYLIQQPSPKWLEGTGQTLEQTVLDSFRATVPFLEEKIGKNMKDWRWGKLHTITFYHSLGESGPFGFLFNDGPYEYGGSHVTVGAASYSRVASPYFIIWGAPWRVTIDMSDPTKAEENMLMGASGQLLSPHYKDQTELWVKGRYKLMYMSPADVQAHTEGTLVLNPTS